MILLLKGQVKAHTRRLKNGKVVQVKAHRRKGERKPQAAGRKTDRPQALTSPFPYRRDKYTPWLYITGDKKEVTRYLEERGYTGKVKDMGNNGILAATDGKQAQAILEGKGGKAAGGETERKMMPTAQAERQKTSEVAAKLGWMDSNGEPTVPFRIPITTGGLPAKGATALIDQRTQMPWAIPPKAIRHISELHQATAEQRTAFARALGDVLDAGLPRAVVERQKWFGIAPEAAGYKAAYYPAARGICVREDLIHDVAAYPDEPRVQQVFRQYLAHELHHEMDFDGEQVAHSHTSPLFEIRRDAVTQSPNGMTSIDMDKLGPVIKEMAAIWAYDQDGLRAMLDYPLLSLAPALLSWRDDFNPGERANWDYKVATVKSEVFAQAGALYYAMPDVLKQRAPTTYQLLENVYEATTLTDERERQSAVRTAFQPPGADLGNGPRSRATDRAGAKNGQAGQSVGRLSKGGHPRLGHSQSPLILLKAQVKAHTRRLKSGKVVQVNAYQDKRSKKAAPAKKGRPAAQPEPSTVRRIKQTETPAFKKWFGDSWVTESGKPGGKPLRVYHGTTQDFSEFQREQANPESDMGAGFYFTNEPEDVGPNYAGEGPDLNSKIQTLAGRIADDPPDDITEEEAENWDGDAAENYIREKYLQHQGAVMPVYLSLQNPVVIHPYGDSTWLDYDEGYDPDEDEYSGEPSGKLAEFIDALRHNASYMDDGSADDVIEEIAMHGMDNGGISAFDLMTMLRDDEGFSMLMDYDQDFSAVANEVFRQSLEDIGFDGVIDQSVDLKFGTQSGRRRPMKGMNPDTVHYIAFKPEQVKSATGNQGSFSRDDPDITKASRGPLVVFRREPTPAQAKAGNYKVRRLNFQGLDISIETDAGQYRRGIDPNGKPWQTLMQHPYGYIRLTEGLDGDHFDVFIGPDEDSQLVFVADMFAPPDFDALDEQKAVLGCNSLAEAREVLLSAYDNPRFVGEIYQLSMDEFKYRIRHTRRDPQPLRFGGWIGVDLDGTLAHYDGWDGGAIGDPVPAMLARVKRWLQDGQDVRILTARVSGPNAKQQRRRIKAWARQHIGRALPVTSEKDHGMRELWDDRAVRVRRNQGVPW